MYLLIVLIAGYAQSQFNASDSSAGLVAGLFIVGSLMGRFVMGKYINSLMDFHLGFVQLQLDQ